MRGRESFLPTKKVLLDAHSSAAMQPFYTTLKTFLCLLLVLLSFPKHICPVQIVRHFLPGSHVELDISKPSSLS
jgi:hypothetical protein